MAGLLGNFKNPFGSGGLLSDPMVRLQMGAAMMGGQTLGQQIGGGLQAAGVAKQAQQEAAKRNQTVEWLKGINPELAQAVEMGALSGGDAYKMAVEKPKHTEFQDRAAALSEYGGDPNTPEGRAFILGGKLNDPNAPPVIPKKGLQPILMRGPDGKIAVGQLDEAGGLDPSTVPDGWTPIGPYEKAFDTAQGREIGTAQGNAIFNLPIKSQAAKDLVTKIDSVINDPNLAGAVGPLQGQLPSIFPGSRNFDEKVAQLKGGAFLQARQELKGGGQITDYEGQRAELALMRASQAKGEEDFKAAMIEFKDAVTRGYQLLEQQAQGNFTPGTMQPQMGGPQGGGRTTQSGVGYTVEQ